MLSYKPPQPLFQSTLPARGATIYTSFASRNALISIHAPRTGSDHDVFTRFPESTLFQSTLPARGATVANMGGEDAVEAFQSTLPARGATEKSSRCTLHSETFQSTLPARGATAARAWNNDERRFQSTLPARGATSYFRKA